MASGDAASEPGVPASGSAVQQEQAAGLWKIRYALTVASITAATGLVVAMTAVPAVLGFPHLQHTAAEQPLPSDHREPSPDVDGEPARMAALSGLRHSITAGGGVYR
jgi:hypothetical protein